MSFLQPWLLAALPLIALPVIIHLINQRRYQTMPWGAMMFLLAANRMSRGYARLRQWLILLIRMLVVAGLIFAISRPLSSGWIGSAAGNKADTTIILLDRSPSMQQRGEGTAESKLQAAKKQLVNVLGTLRSTHWVLIESTKNDPRELASVDSLIEAADTTPTSTTADIPAMLQTAYDYLQANRAGRSEIWIASDLQASDWQPESGRWQTLRDAYQNLDQSVRIHLLAYPQPAADNLSIRVTDVKRAHGDEANDLLLSLQVQGDRSEGEPGERKLPLRFEIDGARSEETITLSGGEAELNGHRISLDSEQTKGWGRVSIPADASPADNDAFFVFDTPATRKTIVIADDPLAAEPLRLAASIARDSGLPHQAETIEPSALPTVAWEEVALVLWQGNLPSDGAAEEIEAFVDRGGQIIFFPPRSPTDASLFGVRWLQWHPADTSLRVDSWRGDQDLLAHTINNASLPLGNLEINGYAALEGAVTPLATLQNKTPLLARVRTPRGGVYFCSTTARPSDSSLAIDGVAFYVMIQRAIDAGASVLGQTRQLTAGNVPDYVQTGSWQRMVGAEEALSTEYPYHAGVFASGDRLLAVNRSPEEDDSVIVPAERLDVLFRGIDFTRVDDAAGSMQSLVQEIWRLFLLAMILAMVGEAALSMPRRSTTAGGAS